MRRRMRAVLLMSALMSGCGNAAGEEQPPRAQDSSGIPAQGSVRVPEEIGEIPAGYFDEAEQAGELVDLYYDTWESFTYEEKKTPLQKHAVVYLPYGYSEEKEYDVFYLMHGGWSDENAMLGSPQSPSPLKNVVDHMIQEGQIRPLILVCPTYNNTNRNGRDSDDYARSMQLTDNYHRELLQDLMPAVEGTYSTYAQNASPQDFRDSRDHRGFGGFSMGAVAAWHTFQYCLDDFRYFLPMSCGTSLDDARIWRSAESRDPSDYFVFVLTGTEDFAYSYEERRTDAMAESACFISVDEDPSGNFAFRVKEGSSHNGRAAMEYLYNGLMAFFPGR